MMYLVLQLITNVHLEFFHQRCLTPHPWQLPFGLLWEARVGSRLWKKMHMTILVFFFFHTNNWRPFTWNTLSQNSNCETQKPSAFFVVACFVFLITRFKIITFIIWRPGIFVQPWTDCPTLPITVIDVNLLPSLNTGSIHYEKNTDWLIIIQLQMDRLHICHLPASSVIYQTPSWMCFRSGINPEIQKKGLITRRQKKNQRSTNLIWNF